LLQRASDRVSCAPPIHGKGRLPRKKGQDTQMAFYIEVWCGFWDSWPHRMSPFAALEKQQGVEYLRGAPCRIVASDGRL
jgi:hypothetical protein